jgi:hypothetical protein
VLEQIVLEPATSLLALEDVGSCFIGAHPYLQFEPSLNTGWTEDPVVETTAPHVGEETPFVMKVRTPC